MPSGSEYGDTLRTTRSPVMMCTNSSSFVCRRLCDLSLNMQIGITTHSFAVASGTTQWANEFEAVQEHALGSTCPAASHSVTASTAAADGATISLISARLMCLPYDGESGIDTAQNTRSSSSMFECLLIVRVGVSKSAVKLCHTEWLLHGNGEGGGGESVVGADPASRHGAQLPGLHCHAGAGNGCKREKSGGQHGLR